VFKFSVLIFDLQSQEKLIPLLSTNSTVAEAQKQQRSADS